MNINFPIKVGSLVEYIGDAKVYKGRVGIVTFWKEDWHFNGHPSQSCNVHFPGLEGKGRDEPCAGRAYKGVHPMADDELKVIG
jgi:hypothetical protein